MNIESSGQNSLRPTPGEIQPIDLQILLPESNFGSSGGMRVLGAGPSVQPMPHAGVFDQVAAILASRNIKYLISVGVGDGARIADISARHAIRTTGVDSAGRIDAAAATYRDLDWRPVDLTNQDSSLRLSDDLAIGEPAAVLLSCMLEFLPDVRPAFQFARRILSGRPGSCLIVASFDRPKDGSSVSKESAQIHASRLWSEEELKNLISASGFDVSATIRSKDLLGEEHPPISLIQAEFESARYLKRLQRTFGTGPDWNPKHLLITSEYHGLTPSGGIGSFISEQKQNYGEANVVVIVGSHSPLHIPASCRGVVSPENLAKVRTSTALPLEDRILKAVEQAVCLFPNLSTIEFQEYQGIGFRVSQAKRAGLLPAHIHVVVHCHGATHYLENGRRDWIGKSHNQTSVQEKIAIESADIVCFPSRFLRDLYQQAGIGLDATRVQFRRYPYAENFTACTDQPTIDTLLFFGKRSVMKGYELFLQALSIENSERIRKAGITRLVFIGPETPDTEGLKDTMQILKKLFAVEEHSSLGREKAIDCIRKNAGRSLVVMPYLADNFPISIYDAMVAGGLPTVVNAGGIPEMLPSEFLPQLMAEANPQSLHNTIVDLLSLPPRELAQLRLELAKASNERRNQINLEAREPFRRAWKQPARKRSSAAVIVPFYNTPTAQIDELFLSLSQQRLPPSEVIVVNDASTPEATHALGRVAQDWEKAGLNIRVVRHDQNQGLAAARNTALSHVTADITINIDSDDIALETFISDIVECLERNPNFDAAIPYMPAFDNGSDVASGALNGYVYRPLGDGVIASQTENLLGHANSGFRTSTLRELGGWDSTGRGMWEDYALFLRLVSGGRRISVIPRAGVLYRVTPKSMSRSYSRWPAMKLIAMNTVGLPRFEAFRLQATLREINDAPAAAPANIAVSLQQSATPQELTLRRLTGSLVLSKLQQNATARNSEDDLRQQTLALIGAIGRKAVNSQTVVNPETSVLSDRDIIAASPLFDPDWYQAQYPDTVIMDPLDHFCHFGGREARSPGPFFDSAAYFAAYPDVADAELNPLVHFLRWGADEGRIATPVGGADWRARRGEPDDRSLVVQSGFFDPKWYVRRYPDLAGLDLVDHFVLHGGAEGRSPGPGFDSARYLEANPDMRESRMNPLVHFLRYGAEENREFHVVGDPEWTPPSEEHLENRRLVIESGMFDAAWYIAQYPEVGDQDPLDHFLANGGQQGRNPGPAFNSGSYLKRYPDVAESYMNPLLHFLRFGKQEGRLPGLTPETIQRIVEFETELAAWDPDISIQRGIEAAENLPLNRSFLRDRPMATWLSLLDSIERAYECLVVVSGSGDAALDGPPEAILHAVLDGGDIQRTLVLATDGDAGDFAFAESAGAHIRTFGSSHGELTLEAKSQIVQTLVFALRPARLIVVDSLAAWNAIATSGKALAGLSTLSGYLPRRPLSQGNRMRQVEYSYFRSCLPVLSKVFVGNSNYRDALTKEYQLPPSMQARLALVDRSRSLVEQKT